MWQPRGGLCGITQALRAPRSPAWCRALKSCPHPSACSFLKNFGFGGQEQSQERAAYHVIQTEHKLLGPMTFAEKAVSVLFVTLVVLWFTREPGFFLGWGNLAFPNEDGTR